MPNIDELNKGAFNTESCMRKMTESRDMSVRHMLEMRRLLMKKGKLSLEDFITKFTELNYKHQKEISNSDKEGGKKDESE